ncbi:MAG TPA: hypothetical protein VM029_17050 [Opitutaceae bacterium]|nr:hypothetical protein [Opitutaceae bacterium]
MSNEPKRPVTIEDLLRLKNAERPPAEFWDRFDRELRAKQLAALVQKRPWWQTLPRLVTGWRRFHFPLGAAAVLTVTFISLQHYSSVAPSPQLDEVRGQTVAVTPAKVAEELMPIATETPKADFAANLGIAESHAPGWAVNTVEHVAAPADPGALLSRTPLAHAPSAEVPPSARYIAANFAAVRASDPALGGSLLGAAHADARPVAVRSATVEPLAQMTPPGEARRAGILSAMRVAATVEIPSRMITNRAGERATRDLSDDRMNDSIRRFNAKADRFSLKL